MKDKIKLEVTTSQANLIIDALDVYLKQYGLKKCSFDAYCQGQKFRRDLHNILTEKGYEESQAELHKEADKEIWEQSVIKCGECGYSVPKAEALEFEHCAECEACLDIPDEWFNELD